MKTKKLDKTKKKSIVDPQSNSGISKVKKANIVKRIKDNSPVIEAVKKELIEQETAKKQIPLRQQVWNTYLQTFHEVEKLNQKQKEIMAFCANKSLTPPKRKKKFLKFIRNCFANQAEFTDEQIEELFDLLLQKYDDYKKGSYSAPSNSNCSAESSSSKVGRNKKKKLNRGSKIEEKSSNKSNEESNETNIGKVKIKKKKCAKVSEMEVDEDERVF